MPTIPYLPADLNTPAEVVEAIRTRRGGTLLNLDRILLYSPVFAEGWGAFMGRVRGQSQLPALLRELAMVVPASLLGAIYEVHHHVPELIKAGATPQQIVALSRLGSTELDASLFDPDARAIIDLAIQMTIDGRPSPDALNAAAAVVEDERRLVELVMTIAAYNMVSRILVAFDIQPEDESAPSA